MFNKLRDEYATKEEETIVLSAVVKTKEVLMTEIQKVNERLENDIRNVVRGEFSSALDILTEEGIALDETEKVKKQKNSEYEINVKKGLLNSIKPNTSLNSPENVKEVISRNDKVIAKLENVILKNTTPGVMGHSANEYRLPPIDDVIKSINSGEENRRTSAKILF